MKILFICLLLAAFGLLSTLSSHRGWPLIYFDGANLYNYLSPHTFMTACVADGVLKNITVSVVAISKTLNKRSQLRILES